MRRRRRGFTLVEVIIDAFVVTTIFGALIGSFLLVLKTVSAGRARSGASALANEQMETLRNLPYNSLSTINGTILPHGTIPDEQTISRSGNSFLLQTAIIYVDDPFDGCAIPAGANLYECTDGQQSSTFDVVPVDYKRTTIEVIQPSTGLSLTKLSSNISAKAAETNSNTGMLLITVNDANGQPIEGADVTITNDDPAVSIIGTTNIKGYIFVASLPLDSHNGYHIVVTKLGYSSDFTTPRTAQNPNQYQPDVSVNLQQVTTQTLSIDHLANMVVAVKNESGQISPGIQITATSNKYTQINPITAKNVYHQTTDSDGRATFSNIEWDSYALTAPDGYSVVVTDPYQEVGVDPSETLSVALTLTAQSSWPSITSVSPTAGVSGSSVGIVIEGSNFPGNATVVLRRAGSSDISPSVLDVAPNQTSITATFNLAGAVAGSWSIVVETGSQTTVQTNGFIIS